MHRFALEANLVDVLRNRLADALPEAGKANSRVLAHPPVGVRIPDLVLLHAKRSSKVEPVTLTYFEANVLAHLLHTIAPVSIDDLCAAFWARPDAMRKTVARLLRIDLLKATPDGFSALACAFPQDVEIVALEAKLFRWRQALDQAREYLRFADRSFVALPAAVARRNKDLLAGCATEGIGVVAVDTQTASIVLDAPRRERPTSGERLRLIAGCYGIHQIDCR